MSMTLDEAVSILKGETLVTTGDEFEEALTIAEKVPQYADLVKEIREKRNGTDTTDNQPTDETAEDVILRNYDTLDKLSESYKYNDFVDSDEDLRDIINNVETIDQNQDPASPDKKYHVLSDEEKQKNLDMMFQSAKLQAELALAEDKNFSKDPDEQAEQFQMAVKKIFFADLARAAMDSKTEKPTKAEQVIGSDAYKKYIERQSEKAREVFEDLIDGGKKIQIKVDSIINSVSDAAVRAENTLKSWKERISDLARKGKEQASLKLQKITNKASAKVNRLNTKAQQIWANRYVIAKSVKGSLSDNKWKIVTNLAANVAFGGALALGSTLAPAVAAYAVYHGASAWMWPVVAEYRKINRLHKEKGEPKKSFKETFKEAWNNISGDKRKRKRYFITSGIQSAVGLAGVTWAATTLNAADAAWMAAGATKATVRVARSTGATAAQLTDGIVAKKTAKTDEEKKEANQTLTTAVIGGLISAGLNYFSAGAAENKPNDLLSGKTSEPVLPTEKAVTDTISAQEQNPSLAGDTQGDAAEAVSTAVAKFPTEYSADMGISERQYQTLVDTWEGTLKEEGQSLDRAYASLTDDVMAENFPGKTREEVLYKFNRLYGFMRRAYPAGNGTLRETAHGEAYLTGRFDKLKLNLSEDQMSDLVDFAQENTYADDKTINDGLKELFPDGLSNEQKVGILKAIHGNVRFYQNAAEMEALLKLLGCGKDITAEEGKAINALLDRTDEILNTGKGSGNTNYLVGMKPDCESEAGQWRQGHRVVHVVQKPVVQEPAAPEPERREPVAKLDLEPGKITVDTKVTPPEKIDPLPIKEPVVEQPQPAVRKFASDNMSNNGLNTIKDGKAPEGGSQVATLDEDTSAKKLETSGYNAAKARKAMIEER